MDTLADFAASRPAWILNSNPASIETVIARLPEPAGEQLRRHPRRVQCLSSSSALVADGAEQPLTVNVFAGLPGQDPGMIVVGRDLRLMLANDFTLAWLAWLSFRLEWRDALYLELARSTATAPESPRLSIALLRAHADVFAAEELGKGWYRIRTTAGFQAAVSERGFTNICREHFHTIFPVLQPAWSEFSRRYREAHAAYIDPERLRPEYAARQFIYTLFGASQKSRFVEWLAAARFGGRRLRILDMGGGYGAMGAELAAMGHAVTVLEMETAKIESIGKWLGSIADLGDRLSFIAGDFEQIERIDGPFDVIGFFGSLLYCPRERCADLLRRCRERLGSGGLLVVHENPRERAAADALDFHHQFTLPELDGYVTGVFGSAEYFSIVDHQRITPQRAADSLMLLVAVNG